MFSWYSWCYLLFFLLLSPISVPLGFEVVHRPAGWPLCAGSLRLCSSASILSRWGSEKRLRSRGQNRQRPPPKHSYFDQKGSKTPQNTAVGKFAKMLPKNFSYPRHPAETFQRDCTADQVDPPAVSRWVKGLIHGQRFSIGVPRACLTFPFLK